MRKRRTASSTPYAAIESRILLSARVLDDIEAYVAEWKGTIGQGNDTFRGQCEGHPGRF
ncbi:MAG TPA: hypothetical protein VHF24_09665 [Acidimicrobiales bacterium]|nr:hypothetical protein [Acidimicrobiales bacterium]